MTWKAAMILVIVLLASGCATYRDDSLVRLQTLPQHYELFDAKLAWEASTSAATTTISGVIKNIRYFAMEGVEIQAATLAGDGREIARDTYFVNGIKENEAVPFILKLPAVSPGSTLRFRYRYIGMEGGGDSGDALTWRQSFDWKIQ